VLPALFVSNPLQIGRVRGKFFNVAMNDDWHEGKDKISKAIPTPGHINPHTEGGCSYEWIVLSLQTKGAQ